MILSSANNFWSIFIDICKLQWELSHWGSIASIIFIIFFINRLWYLFKWTFYIDDDD